MSDNTPHPDIAELAALYAAGALSPAEAEAFEDRLLAGDPEHVREFERVRAAADALLRAAAPARPDLLCRSNLINRLGLSKQAPPFSRPDAAESAAPDPFAEDRGAMVLLRGNQVDWRATDVPGVKARNLFIDREAKRVTVLLKLDPGVVYPDHDHPGVEECLIVDGDIELGGETLHSGDYIRIPAGGQHGTPRTTGGCLLLVTTPLVEAA